MRLAEDLGRASRVYGDRIEQLLLDLGEQVHATFGVSMGSALPTRVRREVAPPRSRTSTPTIPPPCPDGRSIGVGNQSGDTRSSSMQAWRTPSGRYVGSCSAQRELRARA
jgi:hypothetical protein